ncbi:HAD-IA family hydrolase [Paenarthrobacter sp. DKR-5]|uniref:HAD-IA family hydrolase n=1 Tax=Paenarthrobacter sp. DKR-5 TaxID=2835535 RepID=UPI001BDC0913|nr:HAD-IA family hydrolase [Paenarthrobacter sp. DKR-5]MBT1002414.1 HAD-IA family hydrolase [Paenarthrobacter sp. DKR-5]
MRGAESAPAGGAPGAGGAAPARATSPTVAGTLSPFAAVIFDLDGVVTDTAEVHAETWRQLFDDVLQDPRLPATARLGAFTAEDYRRFVDGRTREDGVRTFLQSRGVVLPEGSPGDSSAEWTVAGLGARKNELFLDRLRLHGVRTFPGTIEMLDRLRAGQVPVVLVTASRNAAAVLAAAHLEGVFDIVIDGVTAAELGLPGKPDPALFLEAARRLALPPAQVAVLEDSVPGVLAAHRGGFGLVVGIDRAALRAEMEAAGAHQVLGDVSEFDIGLVLTDPWLLVYEGFEPAHEAHREALTTLGNGYLGTRGTAPESRAGALHYPGTYLAGVYNRLVSIIQGQRVEDEHMVNVPNWLVFDVRIGGGRWWSEGGLKFRQERRELDLRQAVLHRHVLLVDDAGQELEVRQRRVVSMADPHLAALETTLTARGWHGPVSLRSGIDTDVANLNVREDALLAIRHLSTLGAAVSEDGIQTVDVQTSQSHIRIAAAVRTVLSRPAVGVAEEEEGRYWRRFEVELEDGVPLVVDKTVALMTSRDWATSSPRSGALAVLARSPERFGEVLAAHASEWRRLWQFFVVELDAGPQNQLILNLHVFHLLQTLTVHTAELDAGVPARGLHGEGYRGHVFWDELFVLPLVTSRLPSVSRALLDYRWRRLDAARDAAQALGLDGAQFPWQSGSDGTEETPLWLFNPRSGHWVPDHSRLQRHVGLAVAYNAWQYFEATEDRLWLLQHGAELIVEVARLFISLAEHDPETDRFHLRGVMGPDEYHDGYPESPGQGLNDNAYTNVLAAWTCGRAVHILDLIQGHDREDLRDRLRIGSSELDRWEHLSRRMFVPFHGDGVISQFEGYGRLQELDWDRYRRNYGKLERLDLILEAEGDSANRYQMAKQADVLMLLYVFGEEHLISLLDRMDYTVTPEQLARTVDFYLARTAHGSTLSRVAHASVLASRDPELAWKTFREALDADLDDTQGGTTSTGIHLGAMAGTIDVIQRTFAGMRMTHDALVFTPRMPAGLRGVSFQLRYRDQLLDVTLEHGRLRITAAPGTAAPVRVRVGPAEARIGPGEEHDFELPGPPSG